MEFRFSNIKRYTIRFFYTKDKEIKDINMIKFKFHGFSST